MTQAQVIDLDPLLQEKARIWVEQGWRIESQLPGQIVLTHGKGTNHVLHLLLTICTLGVWGVVWLILAATGGERRRIVRIGRDGLPEVVKP